MELPPLLIVVGEAVRVIVGGADRVTGISLDCAACPPEPVQVSV
jgi:hypothetical protein